MHKMKTNYPAAVAFEADYDGASETAARATTMATCRRSRLIASAMAGMALWSALPHTATAQSLDWDSSRRNPFVANGNSRECTAYAWGRFKVLNSDSLGFTATTGRHGGRFYALAVETPTVYRDSVPVRGSLVSWTKPGNFGHVAVVERVDTDGRGSCDISEQNWPVGAPPTPKPVNLSASAMKKRSSSYSLAGYVCPNRPTSIGTLYTSKIRSNLQLDVALLDEDRRNVKVLAALFEGNTVVSNTTISRTLSANRVLNHTWNGPRLTRGKTYTLRVWTTDWRGLKSNKSKTFVW